jgi:hypothetical protein
MHEAEREWLAAPGAAYKTTGFDPAAAFGVVPVQAAFVDLLGSGVVAPRSVVGADDAAHSPRGAGADGAVASRLLAGTLNSDVVAAAVADDAGAVRRIATERGVDGLLGWADFDDLEGERDRNGSPQTHSAANLPVAQQHQQRRRGTLAHIATSAGAMSVVRLLAALPGLGPQFLCLPGPDGSTVAHLQAAARNADVMQTLHEAVGRRAFPHLLLRAARNDGAPPVHVAAAAGSAAVLRYLAGQPSLGGVTAVLGAANTATGETTVRVAAAHGHAGIAEHLREEG